MNKQAWFSNLSQFTVKEVSQHTDPEACSYLSHRVGTSMFSLSCCGPAEGFANWGPLACDWGVDVQCVQSSFRPQFGFLLWMGFSGCYPHVQ